jgi:hypothetical protein
MYHTFYTKTFFVIFIGAILLMIGCRRDEYFTGDKVDFTFSVDTLRIDTVFTSVGSSTRIVKVYNNENEPILVDLALKTPNNSFFRFNADGVKGPTVTNITIEGNDSIYVFVEVTVDPNKPDNISPYIIEDQIVIKANQTSKILYLEAWGQNANYLPSITKGGNIAYLSCDLGEVVWDDPRPYVIYGVLFIDSCTVKLPPGTRVYVHGGVVRNDIGIYNDGLIFVLKNGRIHSLGTIDRPVIIQGDRLEKEFEDVKSQWSGIRLFEESKGNIFTHTTIKNSIVGLRIDSLADVTLSKCSIYNVGASSILARHATVKADNCLMHSCDGYALALTFGGDYTFDYCTVGNFEGSNESLVFNDFACLDPLCQVRLLHRLKAKFTNCIFTGSEDDEVAVGMAGDKANFEYSFQNCAFKIKELLDPKDTFDFLTHTDNCINLKFNDRVFNKQNELDFRLDTMSVLLGKGVSVPTFTTDILDKPRKEKPDMGCYEF